MKKLFSLRRLGWLLLPVLTTASGLRAEIPTVLTDKIFRGSGTIDLLKNATGAELSEYFGTNGRLLLGVDVNEDASGNESNKSQGIAIESVQLLITTNRGSFSFSDLFTNTTAMVVEAGGATAQTYHTLFGRGGSAQINGSSGFDLSQFDDVLEVRNVAVSGTISTAKLVVNFLETAAAKDAGGNELFFDFSGGFEDFALLAPKDAQLLEAAAVGTSGVSGTVTYTTTTVAPDYYTQPGTTSTLPTVSAPSTPTTSPTTTTSTTTSTTISTSTVSGTSTSTGTVAVVTPPSTPTSVALAAPGAPEPSVLLLGGGAVLAVLAAAREKRMRRA